jgi:hypothetical protein
VPAIEYALDCIDERVKEQYRQQAAVESQHQGFDMPEAMLETSAGLLAEQAGHEQGQAAHGRVECGEHPVEDDREASR